MIKCWFCGQHAAYYWDSEDEKGKYRAKVCGSCGIEGHRRYQKKEVKKNA